MKGQAAVGGYTIIEVMIFLAVSGGLLVSIMAIIAGQQQRTQFTTGVRDFETKLQDVINDVETGFFPSNKDLQCIVANPTLETSTPAVTPAPTTVEQGTNANCVFLGKVIQGYRKAGDPLLAYFRVMSVAGKRQAPNPVTGQLSDPVSLEAAKPRAFNADNGAVASSTGLEEFNLINGVEFTSIGFIEEYPDAPGEDIKYNTVNGYNQLGVVSSVALKTTNNVTTSFTTNLGNGRVSLAALKEDTSQTSGSVEAIRKSINESNLNTTALNHAAKGVVICLRDGAGGRPAAVVIGTQLDASGKPAISGQRLATSSYFDDEARAYLCSA